MLNLPIVYTLIDNYYNVVLFIDSSINVIIGELKIQWIMRAVKQVVMNFIGVIKNMPPSTITTQAISGRVISK